VALLESGDAAGKANAAGALNKLACNADNQIAIAQAGAIPHLVALVESGDAAGRANAVGALKILAFNNADNQIAIIEGYLLATCTPPHNRPSDHVRELAS